MNAIAAEYTTHDECAMRYNESLVRELHGLCLTNWTGELIAQRNGLCEGVVVLDKGRIAWAVSSNRHEDLGTFLWRLGRVSMGQLIEVRTMYEQLNGSRKLGALMEDAGILRRSVLRRCLLLHTRIATCDLLRLTDAKWTQHATQLKLDNDVTFVLKEILPEISDTIKNSKSKERTSTIWSTWGKGNSSLRELEKLEGYRASGVLSSDGDVLFAQQVDDDLDLVILGFTLAQMLDTTKRMSRNIGLGNADSLLTECTDGFVAAQCIGGACSEIIFVVLSESGGLGAARYKLKNMAPDISRKISALPSSIRRARMHTPRVCNSVPELNE